MWAAGPIQGGFKAVGADRPADNACPSLGWEPEGEQRPHLASLPPASLGGLGRGEFPQPVFELGMEAFFISLPTSLSSQTPQEAGQGRERRETKGAPVHGFCPLSGQAGWQWVLAALLAFLTPTWVVIVAVGTLSICTHSLYLPPEHVYSKGFFQTASAWHLWLGWERAQARNSLPTAVTIQKPEGDTCWGGPWVPGLALGLHPTGFLSKV